LWNQSGYVVNRIDHVDPVYSLPNPRCFVCVLRHDKCVVARRSIIGTMPTDECHNNRGIYVPRHRRRGARDRAADRAVITTESNARSKLAGRIALLFRAAMTGNVHVHVPAANFSVAGLHLLRKWQRASGDARQENSSGTRPDRLLQMIGCVRRRRRSGLCVSVALPLPLDTTHTCDGDGWRRAERRGEKG
jgi:hypothetical protein